MQARDEAEVVRAVREARGGVRVAGAGHSFTPIVETSGTLLDLSAMRGVVSADAGRRRVTALPATLISDFYEPLWEAGLALRNQGDIDTQQIAGRWRPRRTGRASATRALRASSGACGS